MSNLTTSSANDFVNDIVTYNSLPNDIPNDYDIYAVCVDNMEYDDDYDDDYDYEYDYDIQRSSYICHTATTN